MEVKVDLHSHTEYSPCSSLSLDVVEQECRRHHIDVLAVTDHNTLEGALRLQDRGKQRVIIGEEISTGVGDLIGLFLTEAIPPELGLEQTIDEIREQGGLVYAPHPFDRLKRGHLGHQRVLEVLGRIDIIEVFNGKISMERYNNEAVEFARRHAITPAGGSDSHNLGEMGLVGNIMPDFSTADDFLMKLDEAHIIGTRASFLGVWIPRVRHVIGLLTGKHSHPNLYPTRED